MDGNFDPQTGEVKLDHAAVSISPAIAAAIVAVKKRVKQLGSDERNQHGGYAYVSVDKFYDAIGKLMAEAGLALLIDETGSEVKEGAKGNPWLFCHYECRFIHEGGAVSPPMRRSCALPISGPQAFGAAQSYIEKQLLRQVFKVPTGDKDADDTAPHEGDAPAARSGGRTAQGSSGRGMGAPHTPQAAPAPSEARAEADKRYKELRSEIDASMTVKEVGMLVGCLAWQNCRAAIVRSEVEGGKDAATAEGVATEAMQRLVDRAERRKEMLLADAEPPAREYEV